MANETNTADAAPKQPVVACLNREYGWRLAGVGLLFIGMMLWALYDGVISYPRQNDDYEAVRDDLLKHNITAGELVKTDGDGQSLFEVIFFDHGVTVPNTLFGKIKALNEQARAITVPTEQAEVFRDKQVTATRQLLEQPLRSRHDIQSQFVMAALAALAAAVAFGVLAQRARRRFTADGSGLHGLGDAMVAYSDIGTADWSCWAEKRIWRFTLRDGRKFTLDGWHYAGVAEVVGMVVHHRPDLAAAASGSNV